MTGLIYQINVSPGGVPKRPILQAAITRNGVSGDRQRDTEHHGGPQRAVCLYPLEHILALQAEGHPIYPGAIGENITVAGIDWEQLRPGARLRLGADVELVITSFAAPCTNIAGAFRDGYMNRVSEKKNPGRSRVYARVAREGEIRPGDPVQLLSR
jgi:MOSC domain-containing protein YiiM